METTYIIKSGDTLSLIAERYGTTIESILRLNNIVDPNDLPVGQTLLIPRNIDEAVGMTRMADSNVIEGFTDIGNRQVSGGSQVNRQIRGVRYSLFTNKASYRPGENVVISLVKTNVTNNNITLQYRSSQRYDFAARARQNEVWRWSRGRSFTQETARVILRPGMSRTYQVTWNQRDNRNRQVSSGNYTIDGNNVATGFANEVVSVNIRITSSGSGTGSPPTTPPESCPSGNLVVNGNFENWSRASDLPRNWSGNNIFRSTTSRTGNYAAEMGSRHNERAVLSHRTDIQPGRIYQLSWWARENVQPGRVGSFVLFVEIIYTNRTGEFVGRTEPRYSQDNIPNNAYQRYNLSIGRVPAGARTAEIRFTFEPSARNNNTVKIDDVDLRCLF